MGRGWKSFQVHARRSLHCQCTMKGSSGAGPERKEESSGENLNLLREYQRSRKQNVEKWTVKVILMKSEMEVGNCVIGN